MTLAGKRVLITGGAGYLAANLAERLVPLKADVRRLARADGDLSERSFWDRMLPGTDFIFHFAAQTSVYAAEKDPDADWQSNVAPMLGLLEACRARSLTPLILFAGTSTQCGIPLRTPVDESHPDRPVTVYDRHKLEAEGHLEKAAREGYARGTTLRLANVYGPGPASGKADRGILNQMMRRALKGESLTLYGDGQQLRDYIFVTDVAQAFIAAAGHAQAVNGRHFILSSGEGHTLAQAFELVAERAAALTGRRVALERVAPPQGMSPIESRSFVGDVRALREATGWAPRTALAAGIDRTLQWLREEGER